MEDNYNKDGFLVVFKPSGCTSRDVVNKVSRILGTKRIGHTGTLDPIATGILILTIGKCTKLSDHLTNEYKEYIAEFTLGYETDTLDYTGEVTHRSDFQPNKRDIEEAILSFKGKYLQEVPAYSAVKIAGKKLYEYARNGEEIELPKREVDIKDITILAADNDRFSFKCTVSKGTYIRSLIRDIGRRLGTYATMTSLERSEQSGFRQENSYTLEDIEQNNFTVLSLDEVLKDVERVSLDEEMYKKVSNGIKLQLPNRSEFIKFTLDEEPIALYKKDGDFYKMHIKF